jgi:hypothetical protein
MMRQSFGRIVLATVTAAASCWSGGAASNRVAASEISGLSGYVYVDQNVDGSRDPLVEWVLPGIEMVLAKEDDTWPPLTAMTDNRGFYEFTDLDAGTYRVIQSALPGGYLNVIPGVGQLWDLATGQPSDAFPGYPVNYDQLNGIPVQVVDIELPTDPTQGIQYDFGQLWTGKAWYLGGGNNWTRPPGGLPPQVIPEPSAAMLLGIGAALLAGWRRCASQRA